MSQLARQLIAENKRLAANNDPKAKSLDLGNCGLTDLEKEVPELFECVWLEELIISNEWYEWKESKYQKNKLRNKGKKNKLSAVPQKIIQFKRLKTLRLGGTFLVNWKIKNIQFLKKLTNLHTLDLGFNQISNIQFLEKLPNLQILNLSSNRINNFQFLEKLTSLQSLNLSNNVINNFQFLEKLPNLHTLHLYKSHIKDVQFLEKLPNLRTLNIGNNQISNIPSLEKLTKLCSLDLNRNKVKDIQILEKLPNLHTLDLSFNQISDIQFLEKLTKLNTLNLCRNQIKNIQFLEKLISLHTLDLSRNQIRNYKFVEELTNLHTLKLESNLIRDIQFLEKLISLHTLQLRSNQIKNYQFLKKLTNLHALDIGGNKISDTTFLEKLPNLHALDLSLNNIKEIKFLEKLPNLHTLDLRLNNIKEIKFFKELPKLHHLDLSENQIKEIKFFKELPNLHHLDLRENQIKEIKFFKELPNLHQLDLHSNRISNLQFLEKLPNLHTLDLSFNQISDIQFLEKLIKLQTLNLNFNQINNISSITNLIQKGIYVDINDDFFASNSITLYENPITTPPIEIIKKGNQAILNYFKELELQGEEAVYEAKLLIIGEAGAGKTSLKLKIGNCEAELPHAEKDTTTGIDITQHNFDATADLPEFTMNIWDFGGQEVYHATHQFFLSKRSLYVLVDDGRKEEDERLNYWLQVQELYGQGSPLLLFQNQKGTIHRPISFKELKGDFDNIRELTTLNLKTESHEIPNYCRTLEYYVRNLPQFKQGEKLPKKWVRIREALEKTDANYISLREFHQICRKEGIEEAKRQDFLSDYLHDLGVMLHFQDSPLLKRMVVLRPEWATNAVYAILDHTKKQNQEGQFTYDDLNEVWKKYQYVFEELLALMQKFELCYRLKHDPNRFIVPQLLPKDKPDFEWKNEGNLQLRYEYDFMPKGIVTRFIVRRHKFIKIEEGQQLVWKRGVVLKYKNARALVVEEYRSKAINIRIAGKFPQDLMSIITDEIDDINSGFHFNERMKVRKMVPCICSTCRSNQSQAKTYIYDELIEILEKGRHQYFCNFGGEPFNILEALRNIGDNKRATSKHRFGHGSSTSLEEDKISQKVFIAYDDADEAHLKSLKKHLKGLERKGLLQTWSVNQTIAGSDRQVVLDRQLDESKIVLLLISVDFVNSDTCVEHILEVAMEKHKAGTATVVPIYLRHCDCEGMAFEGLEALPNDKNQPKYVTEWTSKDAAWTNVAMGVKEVLKR